ncbi:hypothetical protein BD309DRAFT_992340 [Dichomitus squalens]|uniref:Uncharacterized protein n=2 Tax=Dichomitus squalens TaxID=114155 RepID=A0A4Q9NJN5_9APHY|nr:uncharacterized protein DICSQDRAFT_175233 [Dichomitus squalens LYAD-421 SS1]EJF56079.1 hypothetical protein DICSQDRAFT_175233 [Dichomitus squalens LYAD-421 SS1]TBU41520.1 hypothetical protein BD309DRAFT_992340 [Dichomitus squalens]TBU54731.1 hypothetical protein BD310DRAFT_827389 [Dichomitus squalens]
MEASPPAVPVEMSALSAIGGDSRAGYGNVEDGDTSEEWFFSPPAFDAEDDKDMVVKYLSRKNSGRTWDSTMTCGLKAMDRRRSFTVEPTLYEKLTLNKFGYAFNNASCAIGGGLFFKIIPLHFHQPRVPIGVRVAEQGNLLQERALRLQSRGFFPGLFPFYHLDDEELSWEFFDPPDYEEWSSESDEI